MGNPPRRQTYRRRLLTLPHVEAGLKTDTSGAEVHTSPLSPSFFLKTFKKEEVDKLDLTNVPKCGIVRHRSKIQKTHTVIDV